MRYALLHKKNAAPVKAPMLVAMPAKRSVCSRDHSNNPVKHSTIRPAAMVSDSSI